MKTLYLAWQDAKDRRWFPVGQLSFDGDIYQFVYTKGALRSPNLIHSATSFVQLARALAGRFRTLFR